MGGIEYIYLRIPALVRDYTERHIRVDNFVRCLFAPNVSRNAAMHPERYLHNGIRFFNGGDRVYSRIIIPALIQAEREGRVVWRENGHPRGFTEVNQLFGRHRLPLLPYTGLAKSFEIAQAIREIGIHIQPVY